MKGYALHHHLTNGESVSSFIENNKLTGATPGRLVRRTWTIPGNTAALLSLYQRRFGTR